MDETLDVIRDLRQQIINLINETTVTKANSSVILHLLKAEDQLIKAIAAS